MPSGACLPFMKPIWSEFIRVGKIFSNLLANNFMYIFISELSNEMGLKCAGLSGDLPGLGSVTTVACNSSAGTAPVVMA